MQKYDPQGSVSDIEVLLNCSHRTAVRRYREMMEHLGIGKWQRVKRSVIYEYFSDFVKRSD